MARSFAYLHERRNNKMTAHAEKLREVHRILTEAIDVLITIPPEEDVTSIESDSVYSALTSFEVSLRLRAQKRDRSRETWNKE